MTVAITYIPARIVEGTRNYVMYSVVVPGTDRLKPIRVYFDRVKDVGHRRKQAREYCRVINDKLSKGWNPLIEGDAPRLTERMSAMTGLFLTMKAKVLRERSMPNYRSRIRKLLDWLEAQGMPDPQCCEFTPRHASDFLDHLVCEGMKARTCNNYINDLKGMGNWAKKRGYWHISPFDGLETMREDTNELRPLTQEEIDMMLDSFRTGSRPGMLVVCGLIYYCAMRPEEISQLKVHQVDAVKGMIRVTSAGTKDHTAEWITVPEQFMPHLLAHIGISKASEYVMSTNFRPGPKRWLPVRYSEEWRRHREKLGLADDVRLYALKDTAFQRLSEAGFDMKRIRDHARHSNVSITDIYMRRLNGSADGQVRNRYPDMF